MQVPLGSLLHTYLLLWTCSRALKLKGILMIMWCSLLILEMKNLTLRRQECWNEASQLVSSRVRISTPCLLLLYLKACCILWCPEETTFFQTCQPVLNSCLTVFHVM